jgi:hypothetical protein
VKMGCTGSDLQTWGIFYFIRFGLKRTVPKGVAQVFIRHGGYRKATFVIDD